MSAYSKKGLVIQLNHDGISKEEAFEKINNLKIEWKDQAVKKVEEYIATSAYSKNELIEQLQYEGFTADQAAYGVSQVGY